jgi:methionyl-tRNA formyltransferase
MRIIMMGTGTYAVPTFQALIDSRHDTVALFTRPDVPTRSRSQLPPNPMRAVATQQGIKVFDPANANRAEAQADIRALQPDLLMVCDYGQILAVETLALARHGGLNLHASLLPRHRGAAPVNWALYHGDAETGNTVIHITPRIDAGPCVAQERIAIDPDETAIELEARLAEAGAPLVLGAVDSLERGTLTPIPQDNTLATRAPKLKKSDGQIDWNRSAKQIRNQVRAMKPWPKTYTYWTRPDGKSLRLILEQVRVAPSESDEMPGTVLVASGHQLFVATDDGALQIDQLQPAGKRIMTAEQFLRGYDVKAGDTLGDD